jgi:hypothetical protein
MGWWLLHMTAGQRLKMLQAQMVENSRADFTSCSTRYAIIAVYAWLSKICISFSHWASLPRTSGLAPTFQCSHATS